MHVCKLSRLSYVRLFLTLWIVACQAPPSMGFSREEYWSGLPCPPPGNLPDSGIEPLSLMSPALAGRFFTTSATWEALELSYDLAIPLLSIYPEKNTVQWDCMRANVHCSTVDNSQDTEATYVSISRGMGKEVVHTYK